MATIVLIVGFLSLIIGAFFVGYSNGRKKTFDKMTKSVEKSLRQFELEDEARAWENLVNTERRKEERKWLK